MKKNKALYLILIILVVSLVTIFVTSFLQEDSNEGLVIDNRQELSSNVTDLSIENDPANLHPMGENSVSRDGSTQTNVPPIQEKTDGHISQEKDHSKKPQDGGRLEEQGGLVPQESIDACSEKAAGDSCSFSTPRDDMNGVCQSENNSLVCVPDSL
jgi:hypothetical protein